MPSNYNLKSLVSSLSLVCAVSKVRAYKHIDLAKQDGQQAYEPIEGRQVLIICWERTCNWMNKPRYRAYLVVSRNPTTRISIESSGWFRDASKALKDLNKKMIIQRKLDQEKKREEQEKK